MLSVRGRIGGLMATAVQRVLSLSVMSRVMRVMRVMSEEQSEAAASKSNVSFGAFYQVWAMSHEFPDQLLAISLAVTAWQPQLPPRPIITTYCELYTSPALAPAAGRGSLQTIFCQLSPANWQSFIRGMDLCCRTFLFRSLWASYTVCCYVHHSWVRKHKHI